MTTQLVQNTPSGVRIIVSRDRKAVYKDNKTDVNVSNGVNPVVIDSQTIDTSDIDVKVRGVKAWISESNPYGQDFYLVEDADPVGDEPLQNGTISYSYNLFDLQGSGTFTTLVDGSGWRDKINRRQRAYNRCRRAKDNRQIQNSITYTIPTSGKLNGALSEGIDVNLMFVHPQVEDYWANYETAIRYRGTFATEEFDVEEGRVEIPGSFLNDVFIMVANHGSDEIRKDRRLEYRIEVEADSIAEWNAIRLEIEAGG